MAAPLIDLFGEEVIQKLFASTWQLREEALSIINDEITQNSSQYRKEEAFVNAVGAVKFTIQDKSVSVAQRAALLLASTCKTYSNIRLDGQL